MMAACLRWSRLGAKRTTLSKPPTLWRNLFAPPAGNGSARFVPLRLEAHFTADWRTCRLGHLREFPRDRVVTFDSGRSSGHMVRSRGRRSGARHGKGA
jgi:hypothetical protein